MRLVLLFFLFASCQKSPTTKDAPEAWVKNNTNPVLKKGQPYGPDLYAISDCWVLFHEGSYKMWYTGGGAVPPDTLLHSSIGYATSPDGINWIKHTGNPVLDISKAGWDSLGVETVTVIIDSGAQAASRYKMWYAGQTRDDHTYEIGYAHSADGVHWTKHTEPVLKTGSKPEWDNCFIEGPCVIKEDGVYKMWYAGYDCEPDGQPTDGKVAIGYATSGDGIRWTKWNANPVLKTEAGKWDQATVQDPHVIRHNGGYHLWYGGTAVEDNYSQQTGYAYSTNGTDWVKSDRNPVLVRGLPGTWDANTASFPSVLLVADTLKMWYTGKDVEPLPAWPAPYFWEIGLAQKKAGNTGRFD